MDAEKGKQTTPSFPGYASMGVYKRHLGILDKHKNLCAAPYILTLIADHGFNLLYTGKPLTSILKNSEDPNEMLHNAAFHLGLHCCLW